MYQGEEEDREEGEQKEEEEEEALADNARHVIGCYSTQEMRVK